MLKAGLYDDLLTHHLREAIDRMKAQGIESLLGKVEPAQLPDYLTRFLAAKLFEALQTIGSKEAARQVDLSNAVIDLLGHKSHELEHLLQEKIEADDQWDVLREVDASPTAPSPRPLTQLSSSSLLTGAPGLPQLGKELELELATADRCDMLVSFVKSGGMRLMREALKKFTARGGHLRLITTSYLGASDPAVVEEIAALPNTEVRCY